VSVDEFREKGYLPEALLNYLALLSWSPAGSGRGQGDLKTQEIMPLEEMARRFSLHDVGHSASVFDEEKLAWVNRHYLKEANPDRLALLALPYLIRAGYLTAPAGAEARTYVTSLVPIFNTSVDRLEQVPARLTQLFEFSVESAMADPGVRDEVDTPEAQRVIVALADELQGSARLADRHAFRGAADRVKQRTGQKGRALFHPIRLALTGAADGPELDLLVPAMERGAELGASSGIRPIVGARERARRFADALNRREPA
jgi:glutamyl-tRNA synthetase/nondiscriminating glutamyl-tRNA synthetase